MAVVVVHGTFRSGKTSRIVASVAGVGKSALCVAVNGPLAEQLSTLLGHGVPVLTVDSLASKYAHQLGQACGSTARKRRELLANATVAPQCLANCCLLAIDDADLIHGAILARVTAMARAGQIPLVMSVRDVRHLDAAGIVPDSVLSLPCSAGVTRVVQGLLAAIYKPSLLASIEAAAIPASHARLNPANSANPAKPAASAAPAGVCRFHPHTKQAVPVAQAIHTVLTDSTVVFLTRSLQAWAWRELRSALDALLRQRAQPWCVYDNPALMKFFTDGIVVCAPHYFSGLARPHVVLVADDMDDASMLEAMTRCTERLDVFFQASAPPPLWFRARVRIEQMLEPPFAFVNWTGEAAKPQAVLSVKHFVHHVYNTGGHAGTTDSLLGVLAAQMGMSRAFGVVAVPGTASPLGVPPFVREHDLHTALGAVAELLFHRAVVLHPPAAVLILPPDCVLAYRSAVRCTDPTFMAMWRKRTDLHVDRTEARSEVAWRALFQPEKAWGDGAHAARVARELAAKPPGLRVHVMDAALDEPAVRAQVAWAVECYTRPEALDARAAWLLAILSTVILSLAPDAAGNLLLACDPERWRGLPGADDRFLDQVSARISTFLGRLDARVVASQLRVAVRVAATGQTVRGDCDFRIGDAVVELKAVATTQNTMEWAAQAAVYAYALGLRHAYVFNVLNDTITELAC